MIQKRNSRIDAFSEEMIAEMDESGDGKVDRYEFLRYVLQRYDMVRREEIDVIMQSFAALDRDGNGFLDRQDLNYFAPETASDIPDENAREVGPISSGKKRGGVEKKLSALFT